MPEHRQFHLDEIIREALHEKVNSGPPPLLEASEAWKQIETRMSEKRKKTLPLRILRNPLLIAAAVLFIFIFATTPKSGIAFNQFTDIFHTIQGNVVHLLGKSGDPGEGSGESDGTFEVIEDSEIISKQMSLEEAKKAAHFPILIPKNLIDEFQLEDVTVMDGYENKVDAVYLNYVGKDRGFILTEMPLETQMAFGTTLDIDDVSIEEVQIKGHKANLVIYKNGHAELIWMTQSHYFSIEGKLTKDEILTIAKSI